MIFVFIISRTRGSSQEKFRKLISDVRRKAHIKKRGKTFARFFLHFISVLCHLQTFFVPYEVDCDIPQFQNESIGTWYASNPLLFFVSNTCSSSSPVPLPVTLCKTTSSSFSPSLSISCSFIVISDSKSLPFSQLHFFKCFINKIHLLQSPLC